MSYFIGITIHLLNAKISIFYEIETFGVLKCRMKDDF